MASLELTASEKLVLALAQKERWPHALLNEKLEFVSGRPSPGRWRKVPVRMKRVGRQRMLSVRWPKGVSGAAIRLHAGGWLLLGLFKGKGTGPSREQMMFIGSLLRVQNKLEDSLARKERTLETVLHLERALSSFRDIKELVASQMVPELVRLLAADRGSVFLIDRERKELYSVLAMGAEIQEIRMPITRGLAGYVARTGQMVNVPDAHKDERFNPDIDRRTGYRTKSVLAAPMHDSTGERIGVVQVINKIGADVFSHEDEELLEAFAAEAGIAIANTRLVEEQRGLFESFIASMASALDARDQMTAGHAQRVTEYAVGVGREMGLSRQELERIRIAGMLHDLGKIGTPDGILKKPGKLTPEEYEDIKRHVTYTRTIVRNLRLPTELKGIAEEASGHHECYDGSGYPDGLRGEQIPFLSRIIAVADVFDAITSKRYYREAMPIERAVEVIREGAGSHFDPKVVVGFLKYFESSLRPQFQRVSEVGNSEEGPSQEASG